VNYTVADLEGARAGSVSLLLGDGLTLMLNFDRSSVKHVLKIFNMIATSCFLTALECTKFVIGRSTAPDPTGGACNAYRWRWEREKTRGEEGDWRDRPPLWITMCRNL